MATGYRRPGATGQSLGIWMFGKAMDPPGRANEELYEGVRVRRKTLSVL
jgi:hypothetical protein